MNLSIKELNELIYSLGITASKGIFVNKELNASLIDKLYSELNSKIAIQSDITDEVIDRLKSHYVSNEEADEDYRSTLSQDEQRYDDKHNTMPPPPLEIDMVTGKSMWLIKDYKIWANTYEEAVKHLDVIESFFYIQKRVQNFQELPKNKYSLLTRHNLIEFELLLFVGF